MLIGDGIVMMGDFASIDWSEGPYFILTETDLTGGSSYTISSTTQLLSVPYSLFANHADTALNLSDMDNDTRIQVEKNFDEDIIHFDIKGDEKWTMKSNRLEPQNVGESVFIGIDAGKNDDHRNYA